MYFISRRFYFFNNNFASKRVRFVDHSRLITKRMNRVYLLECFIRINARFAPNSITAQ